MSKFKAEKAKPTIIHLPNCKIVFNPPYTIVTDGVTTGKAKCNPEDEWSAEKGLELATERFRITRFKKSMDVIAFERAFSLVGKYHRGFKPPTQGGTK